MNTVSVSQAQLLLQYLLAVEMLGPEVEEPPTFAPDLELPNANRAYQPQGEPE